MILSLLVVAMVALITYWWANQGATSALLHMLCVIIAGSIAFAIWEWVTVSFFLRGIRFDEYAWGITLIATFAIVLCALRLISDKLVPKEIRINAAVNTVLGAAFGLVSGVLSVGIVLTGWGFIQASSEVLGYQGFHRSQESNGLPTQRQGNLPPTLVLKATEFAFGRLSNGAFSPIGSDITLANALPGFSDLAGSAMRDSFEDGKSKITAPRGSVRVTDLFDLPTAGEGLYLARIEVDQPAFDRRTMFTLSASQARLVGADASDPGVSYAKEFAQKVAATDALFQSYTFSDIGYFASSPSGAQNAVLYLAFPKGPLKGQKPAFLQVKGLRLTVPEAQREPTVGSVAAYLDRAVGVQLTGSALALQTLLREAENAAVLAASHIETNNTITPASGSVNNLPGSLVVNDTRWLISGAGDFQRGAATTGNRDLRINGIAEPEGTRIVRVNATKGFSPVDLYNMDRVRALRKVAGEDATVELVDRNMNTYQPFGYIWERTTEGGVRIFLDLPPGGRWTLRDLPNASEEDKLFLLYRLPENTQIVGVIFRSPTTPVEKAAVAALVNWTVPAKR